MNDPRQTARNLMRNNHMYPLELWMRYWANGGEAQQFEFEAYLHGLYELDPFDLEVLTWVLEELDA